MSLKIYQWSFTLQRHCAFLQKVIALCSVMVMSLRCGSKQVLRFLIFKAKNQGHQNDIKTLNFMEREFCTGALQRGISIDEIINIQFKPVDWPAKSFVGHWNTFCIYVYQLKLSDLHFVCSKLLFSIYPFQPFFFQVLYYFASSYLHPTGLTSQFGWTQTDISPEPNWICHSF